MDKLAHEGMTPPHDDVINVGDVMYDAAIHYSAKARRAREIEFLGDREYVLATFHREENVTNLDSLSGIVDALNEIHKHVPVVLPVHPRTRAAISRAGFSTDFHIIEPISYLEMIDALRGCKAVLTDSGGLQKEAFFFQKPCLTLRNETEWTELVDMGVNRLVGSKKSAILEAFESMFDINIERYADAFGGGEASTKIANSLMNVYA